VGQRLDGQGHGSGRGCRPACRASFCSGYFFSAESGSDNGPKEWSLPLIFFAHRLV
jgi:hypothetical protein